MEDTENINYKELDRKAILDYLASQDGEILVAKVMTDSGADKLRVYTILFELQLEGLVKVVKASEFGTPETITFCKE